MDCQNNTVAGEPRARYIKFPIPGYPHYFATVGGDIFSDHSGTMKRRSPKRQKNGYLMLLLHVDKKRVYQYVHILMALTFLGERPDNMVVCHFPDQSKDNCRINNLRYDSRRANAAEWLATKPVIDGRRKMNPDRVRELRKLKARGWSNSDLARRYGSGLDTIRFVLTGQCWGWVV